jgi:hypothetical protein
MYFVHRLFRVNRNLALTSNFAFNGFLNCVTAKTDPPLVHDWRRNARLNRTGMMHPLDEKDCAKQRTTKPTKLLRQRHGESRRFPYPAHGESLL